MEGAWSRPPQSSPPPPPSSDYTNASLASSSALANDTSWWGIPSDSVGGIMIGVFASVAVVLVIIVVLLLMHFFGFRRRARLGNLQRMHAAASDAEEAQYWSSEDLRCFEEPPTAPVTNGQSGSPQIPILVIQPGQKVDFAVEDPAAPRTPQPGGSVSEARSPSAEDGTQGQEAPPEYEEIERLPSGPGGTLRSTQIELVPESTGIWRTRLQRGRTFVNGGRRPGRLPVPMMSVSVHDGRET